MFSHDPIGIGPRPFNLQLRLPPLPRSARTGRDALAALASVHDLATTSTGTGGEIGRQSGLTQP